MASKIEFPQNDSWYHHFVSYGETDTMGVLYYAEYLHLFDAPAACSSVNAA